MLCYFHNYCVHAYGDFSLKLQWCITQKQNSEIKFKSFCFTSLKESNDKNLTNFLFIFFCRKYVRLMKHSLFTAEAVQSNKYDI